MRPRPSPAPPHHRAEPVRVRTAVPRRPASGRALLVPHQWLALALALAAGASAGAAEPLRLEEVAEGVHVYAGPHEEASLPNLGAVGNAGVVIGRDSVAVIDTGGSPEFGRRLRAGIAALTDLPVAWVITTHAHPDHFFGHSAFDEDGASFAGHRRLARALATRGPFYLDAFERLVGAAFEGARIVAPSMEVSDEARIDLGDRVLVLNAWRTAHTDNDLTVLDLRTGTLFAGDLVFVDRLPVVDGSLKGWLDVLSELRRVPGRGCPGTARPPPHGPKPWTRRSDTCAHCCATCGGRSRPGAASNPRSGGWRWRSVIGGPRST